MRVGYERGTHGEDSGYADRTHKGQRVGWGASGVLGDSNGEGFEDIGGARRAVDRLNGHYWRGRTLRVMLSKFRRKGPRIEGSDGVAWVKRSADYTGPRERDGRMKQVWKEVRRNNVATMGVDKEENHQQAKLMVGERKKEVVARTCRSMQDLLNRSMMDVGTFRCLLMFESANIRDEAMSDPNLLAMFDELRPHWNYFSSHSRRIWMEVLGLPI
ncbi:hypothetical protein PIB30_092737 [Stylosanthes scabra]|uniref:Uncharacterized protein n=1 Tax=Stylosanthes scabra TaxID=79078 RepID=A0ABU6TVG5_9FABA|nr:hypothetical protein [Stylosanthes scabra]